MSALSACHCGPHSLSIKKNDPQLAPSGAYGCDRVRSERRDKAVQLSLCTISSTA